MSDPVTASPADDVTGLAAALYGRDDDDVDWLSGDSAEKYAAAILASSWLADRDRRIRAEAVREAADRWTQGGWSDVMLPKPTPPAVPVIAYSNRMGDWLRAHADRMEAGP